MARPNQETYRLHITAAGTFDVADESCYVAGIIVSVTDPGTNWSVAVQDRSNPPMALVPPTVLSKQSQLVWAIDLTNIRPFMYGGIDLVAAGTTPGTLDIWVLCTEVPTSY